MSRPRHQPRLRRRRPDDAERDARRQRARSSWRAQGRRRGQQLTGEFMDIGLEPDGSVRSLSTRDDVDVTLPATKDTAGAHHPIDRADRGRHAQGLDEMKFSEGVEYREAATKTQGARIAQGQDPRGAARPGRRHAAGGAVHRQLRFHRRRRCARSATRRRYIVTAGTLALIGQGDHAGDQRRVADAAAPKRSTSRSIRARWSRRATCAARCCRRRSRPATRRRPSARRCSATRSRSASSATTLTYDESTRRPITPGRRGCCRAHTTINADKLTLDETKGDLTATGKVVTNLQIANKQADAGAKAEADHRPRRDASPTPTTRARRPTPPPRSSTAIRAT